MTSSDTPLDQIESEATEWLVQHTAGRLDPAETLLFKDWLQRSAQHRAVYERMRQTWDALAVLQQMPGDLLRHTADLHAKPGLAPVGRRWLAPVFAVAASLLLAIGLTVAWLGNPVTVLIADYSTAPGEIRGVTLPDGSRLELAPSSAVKLNFSNTERRVELLAGSAYFSAVPQAMAEGRPFIVDTGLLSARALGTQFLVEHLPRGDGVAVAEHDVAVTMKLPGSDPPVTVLSPGQVLRYRRDRMSAPDMARLDPQEIAPWRVGNLVFYQVPLHEVVAELNRYRRSRILLANDDLSARVVSGVFRIGEPDDALRVIADELGLRITALPFITVIHK